MILEDKKTKEDIVFVKQQEKKKSLKWVNSIEPKDGHKLYEFTCKGEYFECVEIDITVVKPQLVVVYENGKYVNKNTQSKPKIDIFNPEYKAEKRSIQYNDFKPESIYVTALNYKNACKKIKQINNHLFK